MVTRSQSIKNFNDRMSDLVNAKFMVAEKKVSEVLISISDSVLLFELFQHVTEGFDYPTFKSICFSHDAQGNGCFKLPKTESDVLAFGFLVLMDVDNGQIDLLNLCSEYFPSKDGKQRSYALFATQLLIPFQQIALKLANSVLNAENCVEDEGKQDETPVEEDVSVCLEKEELPKDFGYITQLYNKCGEILQKCKKDFEPYQDLRYFLLELQNYIKNGDVGGITLTSLAINYVNYKTPKMKIDFEKLTNTVAEQLMLWQKK